MKNRIKNFLKATYPYVLGLSIVSVVSMVTFNFAVAKPFGLPSVEIYHAFLFVVFLYSIKYGLSLLSLAVTLILYRILAKIEKRPMEQQQNVEENDIKNLFEHFNNG